MIKAVLLDLDNTLLLNDDRVFAQRFLNLLEPFLAREWGLTDVVPIFRQALKPPLGLSTQTNFDRLLSHLANTLHLPLEQVQTTLNQFYADVYPQLHDCVQPVAGARELIQQMANTGYAVVIATNPLYPRSAIEQRMMWAGLPLDTGLYALITHSQVMHYTKPNPAYYAEILGRVGVEPDEAVMIGDRLINDIEPARQLGLQVFHVAHPSTSGQHLRDFIAALPQLAQTPPTPLQPERIAPQYEGNIGALFGMLLDVQPHFWSQHPRPNEWSILQILCHLRDSEPQTQRTQLERILTSDNPFITAPKPPGPLLPVCADNGWQIAHEFAQERQKTLDFIQPLSLADWQRPARHSVFGLTTLLEMAHFTAQHDRLHLNQLCQTIGGCA